MVVLILKMVNCFILVVSKTISLTEKASYIKRLEYYFMRGISKMENITEKEVFLTKMGVYIMKGASLMATRKVKENILIGEAKLHLMVSSRMANELMTKAKLLNT